MSNNTKSYDSNPDIPDFGARQEMDIIRQNEDLERRQRQKKIAALQRQEQLKRKKLKQLKETVTAWAILLFIVIAVIAIISGIFFSDDNENSDNDANIGETVSSEILGDYTDFNDSTYNFSGNSSVGQLNKYTKNNAALLSDYLNYPSYFALITESCLYTSNDLSVAVINAVRECPQFSNGYIWSSNDNMRFPLTEGYLYDTNASFICAVIDICKWQGDTDFLYKTDSTSAGSKDISYGINLLTKLENAANYFFDKNDLNGGGIRYNEEDGLAYVLTPANNGVSGAKPSNIFHNHSFGYLDLYNNILFNKSMHSMAYIYEKLGDSAKAGFYKSVAEKNSTAINDKFWNNSLCRYAGYIDADGKVHDLGFTTLNLMAVSYGVADSEKSDKILSWINGKTKINTDTASGEKIYSDGSLPIFNTVCALTEGWFDLDGSYPYSGNSSFGKYWQNGGQAYSSAYFNIGAVHAHAPQNLKAECEKLAKALDSTSPSSGEEIFALTSGYLAAKQLYGISTDGEVLYVNPIMSKKGEGFAIKNVSFINNNYGFSFENGKILITAEHSSAVKIKIGSYSKGTAFKLTVIEDEKILSEETVKADNDGYISVYKRFGSTSFVTLEKQAKEK